VREGESSAVLVVLVVIFHPPCFAGNLLVNGNCDLRICDFGLARGVQHFFFQSQEYRPLIDVDQIPNCTPLLFFLLLFFVVFFLLIFFSNIQSFVCEDCPLLEPFFFVG